MLQHEAGVELKVSEILLKCRKGESIWQILQLEKLINTTGILNIREVNISELFLHKLQAEVPLAYLFTLLCTVLFFFFSV